MHWQRLWQWLSRGQQGKQRAECTAADQHQAQASPSAHTVARPRHTWYWQELGHAVDRSFTEQGVWTVTWSSEMSSSRPFQRPICVFAPLPLRCGCEASAKTFAPFRTCAMPGRFGRRLRPRKAEHQHVGYNNPPCFGEPGRRSQHELAVACRRRCSTHKPCQCLQVGSGSCLRMTGVECSAHWVTWCAARSPWVPAKLSQVRSTVHCQHTHLQVLHIDGAPRISRCVNWAPHLHIARCLALCARLPLSSQKGCLLKRLLCCG